MAKKIEIKSLITEYDSLDELNKDDRMLLEAAKEFAEDAYAPYSNFFVGAAVLLENGEIIKGNNQENVAYNTGQCAERVALFAAGAQFPDVPVIAIAVTAKSQEFAIDHPVTPCGACRQVMAEYELRHANNIRLILMGETGKIHLINSVKELLPNMFSEEGLKKR